jgi:condensin complex subunit 3
MPVVTALAFRTQDEYNKLVSAANDDEVKEGDIEGRAFIVGELLRLAIHLDYADETGRRKMFQLTSESQGLERIVLTRDVGEMISQANLPELLIPRCLDVLSKISNGERDLIRVVVDVVTELREGEGDDDMDGVSAFLPRVMAEIKVLGHG